MCYWICQSKSYLVFEEMKRKRKIEQMSTLEVGGRGREGRVLRKRQEEVVIEAREEVGEVGVEGLVMHTEVHGKEDCVALLWRSLGVTKVDAKAVVFVGVLRWTSCGILSMNWKMMPRMIRQLRQASKYRVKQMGGYMILLEAWIQEHFPMFRHAMNPKYTEDLPRAAHWQSRREAKSTTTVRYHEMLDDVH
ncbi:hypothetical protein RHMOL_Rhmol02G0152800 [Rhododendron molle]|uniref:Uncharacterized protein n=1 Tax=Rhododendron molle TaxID=49168 RepID=A0ACC0PT22_RHOML|nr:hypothetical protein RHMOL_Rhmol02G0152800 [Rhododendron molle]